MRPMGAELSRSAVLAVTQAGVVAAWLHVGVLVVGVGGMLGLVHLPRGRRSGAGLGLMAVSMFVLAAAQRWALGGWATAVMAVAFVAGLALVVGPGRAASPRRRSARPDQ